MQLNWESTFPCKQAVVGSMPTVSIIFSHAPLAQWPEHFPVQEGCRGFDFPTGRHPSRRDFINPFPLPR